MGRSSTRILSLFSISLFLGIGSYRISGEENESPAVPAETRSILQMKKDLYFLASEECQGRGIETSGIKKAGDYIAAAFQAAGLKPVNNSYFQQFEVLGPARLGEKQVLELAKSTMKFNHGEDFIVTGGSKSGSWTLPLAFVGYGISAKEQKYDDYQNIDVKGKLVIIIRRAPRLKDPKNPLGPEQNNPYMPLVYKLDNAFQRGAAGVIFISDATSTTKKDEFMDFRATADFAAPGPVLHMKRAALNRILKSQNFSLEKWEAAIEESFKPVSQLLPKVELTVTTSIVRKKYPARNVVGVLEGEGKLAEETIVIGAHYDHLGLGEPGSLGGRTAAGKIHFGADDNASGTTGLLELARRFGALKNRQGRRLVFIAFSGEERGLLGSKHYCKNPLYPLKNTVFMLNMDMIGRLQKESAKAPKDEKLRDQLVVYGLGTAAGIESIVDRYNQAPNFKLLKSKAGTGPSDHDSFYRQKIPVLFFFSGTHKDYHRPSDTAEKINYEGMKKLLDMTEKILTHYATSARPQYQVTKDPWDDPTNPTPKRVTGPRLGFMPGNYEEDDSGVLIGGLTPGGPAEKAGLKEGDRIIEIAGNPVRNMMGYMNAMSKQTPGKEIEIIILRQNKKEKIKATPIK